MHMKLIVKVVLGIAAVPVIAIAGAVGWGVYMGVTRQSIEGPEQEVESVPQEASQARAVATKTASKFTPLPDELDAAGAEDWILENNLFWFEGESLIEDSELCAALDPGAAARVHHALRTGGKSSQPMRLHFFAICGNMPAAGRASFAKEVGAIYAPKRGASSRGYNGEFTKLFLLQTDEASSPYARAVRAYCEVLSSDEIIQALADFGVIDLMEENENWLTHVDERMQEFDAATLTAIGDAVEEDMGLTDRVYLKRYIAELAEQKRKNAKSQ